MNLLPLPQLPDVLGGVTNPTDWSARREEIKDILCRYEYGMPLPKPQKMTYTVEDHRENYCASKMTFELVRFTAFQDDRTFSFPVRIAYHNDGKAHPAVVSMNFNPNFPNHYLPVEELGDRGMAVAAFYYEDVAGDNNDFESGAAAFWQIDRTQPTAPGKLMLWAWAAGLVADYLAEQPYADETRLAVSGHSRLGKTALLAGAMYERFQFVYSNDSGCGGCALFRDAVEGSEMIADITRSFPFWFCPRFAEYANREDDLPFDQHFLLALSAPRHVYAASAELDRWADPNAELRSCLAVGPVYELLGKKPLTCEEFPPIGTSLHDADVGYHVRKGSHFMSREDWNRFVDFVEKKSV